MSKGAPTVFQLMARVPRCVGLWAWARYPNYGGEITLWWGIWILCTPALAKGYWATIASPLFVMLLILKGSGVPLQEKQVL